MAQLEHEKADAIQFEAQFEVKSRPQMTRLEWEHAFGWVGRRPRGEGKWIRVKAVKPKPVPDEDSLRPCRE